MQRYKVSLLQAAAATATDDPRRVVITEMQVLFPERPALVFDLTTADTANALSFVLKEGCSYKISLSFRVPPAQASSSCCRPAVQSPRGSRSGCHQPKLAPVVAALEYSRRAGSSAGAA